MKIKTAMVKSKIDYMNISISTYILMLYFILMPLDSYFAEISSFFSVNYILAAYILMRVVDIVFCNQPICINKNPTFLLYPAYMAILSFINVLGTRKYNSVLFLFMLLVFLFMITKRYGKQEMKLLYISGILSVLLFIAVLFLNTVRINGGFYVKVIEVTDANYLITSVVFLVAVLTYYWAKEKNIFKNILLLCIIGVFFIFTLLIGTRGGLFACLTSLAVTLLCMNRRPMKTLLLCLAVAVILFLIAYPFIPDSVLSRFTLENMLSGGGSGRLTIWKNYLWLYKTGGIKVWLFGYGKDVLPDIYFNYFGRVYYPHNMYIKALADGGIVGLILLISLCIGCIKKCIKDKSAANLGAWLGFMVGAFFLDMDNMRIFWFLLFVIYMKPRDVKMISWRGVNGFFNSRADLQRC